jgi:hypothetical protein
LLLLHLTLQASGSLCAMQAHASHDSAAHALRGDDMDGMPLNANSTAATVTATNVAAAAHSGDCHGPIPGDDCRSPWAPGHCSAMTACGVSAAIAAVAMAPTSARAIAHLSPSPELVHSGPTFAPELPPPRA